MEIKLGVITDERKQCLNCIDEKNDKEKGVIAFLLFFLEDYLAQYSNDNISFQFKVSPQLQYHAANIDYDNVVGKQFIDVYVKDKDNKDCQLLIKILFCNESAYIPNIMIHPSMKHKGVGKKLLFICRHVLLKFKYRLFIVQMVDSFRERMIKRGAIPCEYDCVEITEETDLEIHIYQ